MRRAAALALFLCLAAPALATEVATALMGPQGVGLAIPVMIFLIVFVVIMFLAKRAVWAGLHHRDASRVA